jgi:hypothetical protein
MPFLELNSEGFLFTEIAGEWTVLKADFGSGYRAAACVGAPAGTRTWTIRIDALPHAPHPVFLISGQTRAIYLWQFFKTSKANQDQPFWLEVEDPETTTRKKYLASFSEHRLSYEVFCAQVYGTGLTLRERRVLGTVSPIAV